MGIIQRQTIKGSIYSYLGVIVGFLGTGIIMPNILREEEVGLVGILVAISAIYAQFSTLGFGSVTTRLFPYFRNTDNNHNGFAFLTVAVGFVGFVLALAVFFILKPYLIENNIEKSPLLVEYIWFLVPLIFFRSFFLLLDNYNKVLYDATTGTFLSDFIYRFLNLLLLGAYFLGWINFFGYVVGYTFALCFPAIYLAILLIVRGQLNLKPQMQFISKPFRKEITTVAVFGIIGGLSGVALQAIDKIMVNGFLDLSYTGIYTISFFFGTIILIPNRALSKISSPILADAWKDNDTKTINTIYYQSSINQFLAGSLLFILLIANLHNVFQILPPEYASGKTVLIVVAFGNLIASSTGIGMTIIVTSKKYKVQAYLMLILIVLTILTNLIFIPLYGINGAAIATCITLLINSIMRVMYLKRVMHLFPYKRNHLALVVISIVTLLLTLFFIPDIGHWLFDAFVRSVIICIIYAILIYTFKISSEVNKTINNVLMPNRTGTR